MKTQALRIGELASRVGVTTDAIRYYEREGLLPRPPRTDRGYRQYGERAIETVRFVRNAIRIGFSVKQVAAFLRARDAGRPPCATVRAAGDRLLADLDRRIADLTATRAELASTLNEWDARLASTPPGTPARLLEAIGSAGSAVSSRPPAAPTRPTGRRSARC